MPETIIQADLSPAEWKLVQALRGLPESDQRERMFEVIGELLFFVQNPRCQGVGAEGFPCGEPRSSCDECHQTWDLLEGLTVRVEAGAANR